MSAVAENGDDAVVGSVAVGGIDTVAAVDWVAAVAERYNWSTRTGLLTQGQVLQGYWGPGKQKFGSDWD